MRSDFNLPPGVLAGDINQPDIICECGREHTGEFETCEVCRKKECDEIENSNRPVGWEKLIHRKASKYVEALQNPDECGPL